MRLLRLRTGGVVVGLLAAIALVALPSAASSASSATIKVPCDIAALQTAITNGNTAGSAKLKLAPGCVYTVSTPAGTAGFPLITGDIVISGANGTILRRSPSAAAFRVFEIDSAGSLALEN